jgi:hypothetical protein
MSSLRYDLVFYIPEDPILHSDRRENLKSYLIQYMNFSPVGKMIRNIYTICKI